MKASPCSCQAAFSLQSAPSRSLFHTCREPTLVGLHLGFGVVVWWSVVCGVVNGGAWGWRCGWGMEQRSDNTW